MIKKLSPVVIGDDKPIIAHSLRPVLVYIIYLLYLVLVFRFLLTYFIFHTALCSLREQLLKKQK